MELHDLEDDPAGQGVAIGVQSGGRVAKQHVARLDAVTVERLVFLHHADDRAGQVESAGLVEPRHLGRLAAGEGHPVGAAAPRHALHDAGDLLHRERGARHVVHERDRPRAVHQDVVDAVVDEVLAHRVEPPRLRAPRAPWCRRRRCSCTSTGLLHPGGHPHHAAERPDLPDRERACGCRPPARRSAPWPPRRSADRRPPRRMPLASCRPAPRSRSGSGP